MLLHTCGLVKSSPVKSLIWHAPTKLTESPLQLPLREPPPFTSQQALFPLHEDNTFPNEPPKPKPAHAPLPTQDFVMKSGTEAAALPPSESHEVSPTQEGPEIAGWGPPVADNARRTHESGPLQLPSFLMHANASPQELPDDPKVQHGIPVPSLQAAKHDLPVAPVALNSLPLRQSTQRARSSPGGGQVAPTNAT